MKLKLLLILVLVVLLCISFVKAQGIDSSGCTSEGVFLNIESFVGSSWQEYCETLCIDEPCTCQLEGILVKDIVSDEALERIRGNRVQNALSDMVRYVANPLVEHCKNGNVHVVEELYVVSNGEINRGTITIGKGIVEIGRMTCRRLLPHEVRVSEVTVNFTAGDIYFYDGNGYYERIVSDVCANEDDRLIVQPHGRGDMLLAFRNLRDPYFIDFTRTIAGITGFHLVGISSTTPFYCYYDRCSQMGNILITPQTHIQPFVLVVGDGFLAGVINPLLGIRRTDICSNENFLFAGNQLTMNRCANLVTGEISYYTKEKEGEYAQIREIIKEDGRFYYNIESLSKTGTVQTEVAKITDENVISKSGNFIIEKKVQKEDLS